MIEPAVKRNFGNAPSGMPQFLTAFFQPVGVDKINRGFAQIFFENQTALAPAHAAGSGNILQCHLLRVMTEYV